MKADDYHQVYEPEKHTPFGVFATNYSTHTEQQTVIGVNWNFSTTFLPLFNLLLSPHN